MSILSPDPFRAILRLAATTLILACCALPRPGATLAADEEEPALRRLRAMAASISTLSCDFTQATNIPLFTEPVVSKGLLRFQKPDRLVWEYTHPMREGLVLAGEAGFRWEGARDKRAVFITSQDPLAGFVGREMLAWISFDAAWIHSHYDITVESESPLKLLLKPKHQRTRAVLDFLRITFSVTGVAETVTIYEANGGDTTISFFNVSLNKGLADKEFQ